MRFNEALSGYGYEDTMLALELKALNVSILHMDNPTRHLGLEAASEFIEKTGQAMLNLTRILRLLPQAQRRSAMRLFGLLRLYRLLRLLRLRHLTLWMYRAMEPFVRRNINGRRPWVRLFQLYKLAQFIHHYQHQH